MSSVHAGGSVYWSSKIHGGTVCGDVFLCGSQARVRCWMILQFFFYLEVYLNVWLLLLYGQTEEEGVCGKYCFIWNTFHAGSYWTPGRGWSTMKSHRVLLKASWNGLDYKLNVIFSAGNSYWKVLTSSSEYPHLVETKTFGEGPGIWNEAFIVLYFIHMILLTATRIFSTDCYKDLGFVLSCLLFVKLAFLTADFFILVWKPGYAYYYYICSSSELATRYIYTMVFWNIRVVLVGFLFNISRTK